MAALAQKVEALENKPEPAPIKPEIDFEELLAVELKKQREEFEKQMAKQDTSFAKVVYQAKEEFFSKLEEEINKQTQDFDTKLTTATQHQTNLIDTKCADAVNQCEQNA